MNIPQALLLQINGDPDSIAVVARRIEALAADRGWPQRLVFDLNLAIDELVTNAFAHGLAGRPDAQITIRLQQRDDRIELEILDNGIEFNPLAADAPDLDEGVEQRPVGGLGIHLVRQMMDQLCYQRVGDRNRIRALKRLR